MSESKIIRIILLALFLIVLFPLAFLAYGIYWNYSALVQSAYIIVEQELNIKNSELKKTNIVNVFLDPTAEYWFLLGEGFNSKNITNSSIKYNQYDLSPENKMESEKEIVRYFKETYQFDARGFQAYEATDAILNEGSLCREDDIGHCKIIVYGKSGDRYLFVYISSF